MSPKDFEDRCNALNSAMAHLDTISENEEWKIQNLPTENKISITAPFGQLTLDYPESIAVNQLRDYVSAFPKVEPWMQHCAVDGKKGEAYKQLWTQLIQQLQDTSVYAERLTAEKFGKDVRIFNPDPDFADAMKQLLEKYKQGGKISKLALLFNKQLEMALNGATVNGQQPQTVEDCQLILHVMEMKSMRDQCASYWNDLLSKHGVPAFYDLDVLKYRNDRLKTWSSSSSGYTSTRIYRN